MVGAVLVAGRGLTSTSSPIPGGISSPPVLLVTAAIASVGSLVGYRYRRKLRPVLRRITRGFSLVTSPRSFVTRVLSWKIVAWTLRVGAVYAFLVAFHLPATSVLGFGLGMQASTAITDIVFGAAALSVVANPEDIRNALRTLRPRREPRRRAAVSTSSS